MLEPPQRTIEQAFSRAEADADATLKTASALIAVLRRCRNAARTGNTRDLMANLESSGTAIMNLNEQVANFREAWDFDTQNYMEEGSYTRELIETAQRAGLSIHETEGLLFSYPSIVRISPRDGALYINKKRDLSIRPSVVTSRLRREQQSPPAFRPQPFLESLYKAYKRLVCMRGQSQHGASPDILLLDVYEIFTLLPGQASEYTKQDFVRDVYRLHASGVSRTKDGAQIAFHSSTVTKSQSKRLTIVTESGEVRFYATIRFSQSPAGGDNAISDSGR